MLVEMVDVDERGKVTGNSVPPFGMIAKVLSFGCCKSTVFGSVRSSKARTICRLSLGQFRVGGIHLSAKVGMRGASIPMRQDISDCVQCLHAVNRQQSKPSSTNWHTSLHSGVKLMLVRTDRPSVLRNRRHSMLNFISCVLC